MADEEKASKAAKALSQLGAAKGGRARARSLSPEERSEIARNAVLARWSKEKSGKLVMVIEPEAEIVIEQADETTATTQEPVESLEAVEVLPPDDDLEMGTQDTLPVAKYRGFLNLVGQEIPCYVLEPTGQRLIGRTATAELLSGIKGGGGLERYIEAKSLKPFINQDLILEGMVAFRLPEVEALGKHVKGLPADLVIEICNSYVAALSASMTPNSQYQPLTERQTEIAIRASMFLSACAKVGLDALIDEATGAQYERAEDALQVKLRAYLETEMRKWERTFPDELWLEFGRLTNWKGRVTQRPKYWGKLVMELVYEYLDKEVADWLRKNAPKPRHGQNYHQWLTSQYGLKKLVEHLWMLIGVAKTCDSIDELKQRMEEMFGKRQIQYVIHFKG